MAGELLYVASGGTIEVKTIDPETGRLGDFQKAADLPLSKFTFSRDKRFLYAQATMEDNPEQVSIATYAVAADGKLSLLNLSLIHI